MTRRFARAWRGAMAGAFALALLPGCYSYAAPSRPVEPGRRVALDISDVGRVALAASVGSGADRVEGHLVDRTDSTVTLRVTGVRYLRGGHARWTGEALTLRTDQFHTTRERRLSKGRTLLMAAAVVGGVLVLALTQDFDIFGLPFGDGDGAPGEGTDQ